MKTKNIILLHVYGQSAFNSSDILAYGSLENLTASDILADVPSREKSLKQLWEAACMVTAANTSDSTNENTPAVTEGGDAERG